MADDGQRRRTSPYGFRAPTPAEPWPGPRSDTPAPRPIGGEVVLTRDEFRELMSALERAHRLLDGEDVRQTALDVRMQVLRLKQKLRAR